MTQISIKSQNHCEIRWSGCSTQEWDSYFQQIPRSNLLQSRGYGDAAAIVNHQRVRRGIIYIGENRGGLVQILEAGILGDAVHAVILDRGPLWFKGFGGVEDFAGFVEAFRIDFPKRLGRRVRFIPEISQNEKVRQVLRQQNFIYKSQTGYQTYWLDLRDNMDVLRTHLEKKWRNSLSKAERTSLDIKWDVRGEGLPWLMERYVHDQKTRNYQGPSLKMLMKLAMQFVGGQNMLIGTAMLDNSPIAAILIFIHGSSATYQVGFTSEIGRDKCAHHLLLWNALAVLKERSVYDFDLGGVNDESAQGVKSFKQGLGGQMFETPGLFT